MSNKRILSIPEDEQWKIIIHNLREIAIEKNISQDQIAKLTGFHPSNVSRFFRHKYAPTLHVFLKYCKAIGVNIFIESKD